MPHRYNVALIERDREAEARITDTGHGQMASFVCKAATVNTTSTATATASATVTGTRTVTKRTTKAMQYRD